MNIDKIEIVSEFKHLQIRTKKALFDAEGNEVSAQWHRETIMCGDFTRVSEIGGELPELAAVLWTSERVAAYQAAVAQSNNANGEVQE